MPTPGEPTIAARPAERSSSSSSQNVDELVELRLAADELGLAALFRPCLFLRPDDLPDLDRLGLPLRLDGLGRAERERVHGREIRRPADEDAVGRRGRLDPRGGVEHVAGSRPLALARPRPEHHERLAGVDAGPDVEVEPLVLLVQLGDSLPDRERRADGALGIVLVGLRRAEQREDGVAAELLEGAAVGLELAADACVVRSHERLHVLGVEILGASGRADEVDEDRGDDLSLLARRRCGGKRTPAEAAKPELCGIRFATRWADGGLRLGGLRLGSRERGAAEAANAELVGVLLAAAGADLHVFECTSRLASLKARAP